MIKELLDAKDSDSIPDLCLRLGTFLGLEKAVPENVLMRAINDPPFANDLITCRNTPGFLGALFDDPVTRSYDVNASESKSNLDLISKATTAFIKWGKAGFSTVDLETLERRENACLRCPHLKDPERTLQKLMSGKKSSEKVGSRVGKKVCELCGCTVSKKMRLPTESCPSADPILVGMTRWNEPIAVSTE